MASVPSNPSNLVEQSQMCFGDPSRKVGAPLSCSTRSLMSENEPYGIKTFNKGSLGSRIDEERSEARNVV